MGERLLLARSFDEPIKFDLESIRECIGKIKVTNLVEQEIPGELIRCEYRAHNDIAHLSVDSDLLYISTEARDAGYDLAYKIAKCLNSNVYIVRGDLSENAVPIDECQSPKDLKEKLARSG